MSLPLVPPKAKKVKPESFDWEAHRHWRLEPKFDGWRLVAHKDASGELALYARTGTVLTDHLFPVASRLAETIPPDTILDGEVASIDDNWGKAQTVCSGYPKVLSVQQTVGFFVFDMPRIGGQDWTGQTLTTRREGMQRVLAEAGSEYVLTTPQHEARERGFQALVAEGYEGVVLKDPDSLYYAGKRMSLWIAIKTTATEDCVVMDFIPGEGERGEHRKLGAMTFGQYKGDALVKRGQVGGGFTDDFARWVWDHRDELRGKVIEVKHFGIGNGGGLRHPQLVRIRDDKPVEECVWS